MAAGAAGVARSARETAPLRRTSNSRPRQSTGSNVGRPAYLLAGFRQRSRALANEAEVCTQEENSVREVPRPGVAITLKVPPGLTRASSRFSPARSQASPACSTPTPHVLACGLADPACSSPCCGHS